MYPFFFLIPVLFAPLDGFSNLDMFDLEKDLPDELMGGAWGEQPGVTGPKPPAQGPGPGGQMGPNQQLNGDDPAAALQRQINNQLLQVSIVFIIAILLVYHI